MRLRPPLAAWRPDSQLLLDCRRLGFGGEVVRSRLAASFSFSGPGGCVNSEIGIGCQKDGIHLGLYTRLKVLQVVPPLEFGTKISLS